MSLFVPPGRNSVSGGYAAPMSPKTRNFVGTVSRNTGDAWRTLLSCGAAHAAARGREQACTRARACCRRGHPALQPAIAARARLAHPPWAARTGPRRPSCSRAFGQTLVPARRLWKSARRLAAEVGDARPLALAAAAGVRHVDGRGTTAGGLPSAREQVRSHANAAWQPFGPVGLTSTAATARSLPETPRSTAEEHPAPARSMAWPLPLSWRGCGGPRAATSSGKPVEWRVAFCLLIAT